MIDPGSRGRSQRDGEQLFEQYRQLGLTLTPANNAREAGIYEVWGRLSTERLRVFTTLQNWRSEYRIYRRSEKGEIVKENDHLMDDTRYLFMSGIAIAAQRPFEQWAGRPGFEHLRPPRQLESDYDPYAEARRVGGSETQSRWVTHHMMPGSLDWHSRR